MRTEGARKREASCELDSAATESGEQHEAEREPGRDIDESPAPVSSAALVYAARQVVFTENQRATAIYQVVSGAVLLSREVSFGRRQVFDVVGPGGFLGVVPGTHYGCQAQALARTSVRRIDRNAAEQSAPLQRAITLALMRQVEKMRETTNMRSYGSAIERVAALVLSLPQTEAKRGNADSSIDYRIALNQTEMASYLGLAIETVCRTMRELKRRGAVGMLGRDCIMILDRSMLAELAAEHEMAEATPSLRSARTG